jgi:hypothetical protein
MIAYSEGEGHSLGQTSNSNKTPATPSITSPAAAYSPGYRLGGGGDPEKEKVNGADGAGVGALSPTSAGNAEEREKRLAAAEKRRAAVRLLCHFSTSYSMLTMVLISLQDKYKDVQVKPRAFSQIEAR